MSNIELNWKEKTRINPYGRHPYDPLYLNNIFQSGLINGFQSFSYDQFMKYNSNFLCESDNEDVLIMLLNSGFKNKIDLVYLDPPFKSENDYSKEIYLKGDQKTKPIKMIQYTDSWEDSDYFQFIYEKLIFIKELLSDQGSIYMHCDEHRGHYLKIIMDEVFGEENFRREIIWKTQTPSGFKTRAKNWIRNHDLIYYYGSKDCIFNKEYQPYDEEYLKNFNKEDEEGKYWWHNKRKHRIGKGLPYTDVWSDIHSLQTRSVNNKEGVSYPTQKPETLIERIIKASSNKGSIVLDCFTGSGSAIAVAERLDRRWIGIDMNKISIHTTIKRLLGNNQEKKVNPFIHWKTTAKEQDTQKRDPNEIKGSASLSFSRGKNIVQVLINEYFSVPILEKFGISQSSLTEDSFKKFIDYILIDTNHDKGFFDVTEFDIPIGKQDTIQSCYTLSVKPKCVAFKLIDIFGDEMMIYVDKSEMHELKENIVNDETENRLQSL